MFPTSDFPSPCSHFLGSGDPKVFRLGPLKSDRDPNDRRTGIALPARISASAQVSGCLVAPLFSLCEAAEPQVFLRRPGLSPTWSLIGAQTLEKDSKAGLEKTFWGKVLTLVLFGSKEKSNWRGTGERCPGRLRGSDQLSSTLQIHTLGLPAQVFFAEDSGGNLCSLPS